MDTLSDVTLSTGNKMPVIGIGTWQLTENTAEMIAHALENGYRMIDTSGDYGTQPGIADGIAQSGKKRDEFYLVTKVEEYEDAYESTKNNLRQLKLEYADLMLIHRPPKDGSPGYELWDGLIRARNEGLTRDIGVSNYSIRQVEQLAEASGEMPAVNQIEWSPFGHSQEVLEFCQKNQIIIQAYSPLTRTQRLGDSKLAEIASHYNKTTAQLLIRWNLQLGTVPLPKANRKEHQLENLDVFDFVINNSDMLALNSLNERYSSLGSLPYEE